MKTWTRPEEVELFHHAGRAIAMQGDSPEAMPLLHWDTLAHRLGREPDEVARHACGLGLHLWHARCRHCGYNTMGR